MEQKEKFVNLIQKGGKKSKAEKIFYTSVEKAKNRIQSFQLSQAIDNVKPLVEIRKVRIGGSTYQVPVPLPEKRQSTRAIKWMIESARQGLHQNKKQNFADCLAKELCDAYAKQGATRAKRDQLHKLAEVNRAYIRYRWW